MIKGIETKNLSLEANKLKNELVQETLKSLFMNKDNRFDLSTDEGIHQAVSYFVNFHLQQKIEHGEIQISTSPQTASVCNGGKV